MARLVSLLLALALATPALASDGVLEINQTCAVETGCFTGDSPGMPVTITTPGSYRLTSNLVVPSAFQTGISITKSDVGIDLNNFSIVRSGCEGATTDCTPAAGIPPPIGVGVSAATGDERGLSVKNGSITGMGAFGVSLAPQAEVTNLRVRWNRVDGISVGAGSTVSGNAVHQNGGEGISTESGSTISGNTVYNNGGDGIQAGEGSTVSNNTAIGNGVRGIATSSSSTVQGNVAFDNTGNGIEAGTGSTVRGNTARGNLQRGIDVRFGSHVVDNTAYNNGNGEATDDGISCQGGCTIHRNTARSNSGYGIRAGSTDSSYKDNTVSNNATGTVLSGTDACGNVLNNSLTCP